ncbi:uncharacterized protein LOC135214323 [Macrobrachium nipponense]|uniref:uncharacterized protein LOC135214323 n=1 Tax=Macrobrachium nipponense TaxID=159736 RepID=UPI0030C87044
MSRANMPNSSSEHSKSTTTSSSRVKRAPSSVSNGSQGVGKILRKPGHKQGGRRRCCSQYHLNSVWSVWYCLVTLGFMGYLVFNGVKRFILYASLPWPEDQQPYIELNAYVGLVGASVVVLPFFLVTSAVKVGNLANDGFKLGASLSTCSRDPPPVLEAARGVIRNLWLHGVPTAPFLHLVAAFCLLLPRTVMDATLISAGFLPRDEIWRTDLDFLVPHNDRLVVFRGPINATGGGGIPTEIPAPTTFNPDAITFNPVIKPLPQMQALQSKESLVVNPEAEEFDPEEEEEAEEFDNELLDEEEEETEEEEGGGGGGGGPTAEHRRSDKKNPKKSRGKKKDASRKTKALKTKGSYRSLPTAARLPEDGQWHPLSPELLNYTIALLVFAIRYPSVFWHTNKAFGLLFSLQLMLNGIHTILTISAFTILYKLHVCGGTGELHGGESFLLDLPATVGLMVAAVMVVTVSSSAIYFYGYHRFTNFLIKSRQRYHITYENEPCVVRPYAPHCAALVVLVALGVTHGPLLWDMSLVYRGSLDAVVLAAVIGSIVHLFLWIVLWLFLTVKTTWTFKLRVTVARACVSSARSIKLVNDVELASGDPRTQPHTPLLIVGSGKAYAINDNGPKKAIMNVIQKTHQDKRSRGEEEEIYWLRPSQPLRSNSASKTASPRAKVTFDEEGLLSSPSRRARAAKSPKIQKSTYRRATTLSDSDDEAGDYAILTEAPPANGRQQEDPRYVDRQQILAYQRAIEERASSQNSDAHTVPDYEDAEYLHMRSPVASHVLENQVCFLFFSAPMTPRSTRSNDSGMVQEERSQRSDSVSTTSSNTPPENSEESGVLSGATDLLKQRSNSVDDLTQLPPDPNQVLTPPKAMSMQRPPMNSSPSSPYGYCPGGGKVAAAAAGTVSPVPGSLLYPATESTVVIRRQRSLAQDIKPPVDPIYGTRALTSFTDQQDTKKKAFNEDLMAMAQNTFNSSQSASSSGYQSANTSSASNSASNSPVPMNPATTLNPGQTVGNPKPYNGGQSIYGHMNRPGARVNTHNPQSSIYGRTTSGSCSPHKFPQAPQIPLPPIPQGDHAMPSHHQGLLHDIYGRTTGPKACHLGERPNIYGTSPARHPVGRSISLRSATGAVPKYHAGTFPHLPRDSQYNTSV